MIKSSDLQAGDAGDNFASVPLAVRVHRLKFWLSNYWWILVVTIMIGLAVQEYRCLKKTPMYYSHARMMASGHVTIAQDEVYNEQMENFYGTQVALMKSPQTVNEAMERVSAIHPEAVVDNSADVEASVEPRTTIFDLSITSTNGEYAKLLLDAIMDTYLANKRGRRNQTTDDAVSAVTEEISRLDAEIRNDEQQLLDFQKENNVLFIEQQSNNSVNYLLDLNNELAGLTREHDLLSLESKEQLPTSVEDGIDGNTATEATPPAGGTTNTISQAAAPGNSSTNAALATGTASSLANSGIDGNIVAEEDAIEKLKIRRDAYGQYLQDKHPKMIELADEIDKEEKFLEILKTRNQAMRDVHTEELELQIKNLQAQIAQWDKKSLDLTERLGTYQQLKNKLTREQALYNQLASSIQNVDLNKLLDQENVVIMEAASPASPILIDYPTQMTYGLVGGLLGGAVIIYLISRLDNKIHSPLELEGNIDFPLVGQIPYSPVDKQKKRVPLLSEHDERHVLLESYRNLRSAILFGSSDVATTKSIMVSSAAPGEGKSTMAANLATVFARSGARVLLIDADLRRGVLHTLFNIPVSPGLSDYLREEIHWRDTIKETRLPNLQVLPRGTVLRQAGDLLLGSAANQLLQESITEYDLVVWDTAPLLAADDAANLCSKVDLILFVARVEVSSISTVKSSLEELSQRNAKIFGIVLNAVKPSQPGYYHKYKYKEYYAAEAKV